MSFLGAVKATELGADTPQHQEASSAASSAVCLPRASPYRRPDTRARWATGHEFQVAQPGHWAPLRGGEWQGVWRLLVPRAAAAPPPTQLPMCEFPAAHTLALCLEDHVAGTRARAAGALGPSRMRPKRRACGSCGGRGEPVPSCVDGSGALGSREAMLSCWTLILLTRATATPTCGGLWIRQVMFLGLHPRQIVVYLSSIMLFSRREASTVRQERRSPGCRKPGKGTETASGPADPGCTAGTSCYLVPSQAGSAGSSFVLILF